MKRNLIEFGLTQNLDQIKAMSKYRFKKLVQGKSKEFAFHNLIERKEKHSKLRDLFYVELKLQQYLKLEEINVQQALTVFSFRTRMAKFSENFRNCGIQQICPMCQTHLDNQPMSFQCKNVLKEIDVKEKYERIFSENISVQLTKCLLDIVNNLRKNYET